MVFVYPTTPLAGGDIDADKVPASINAIDAGQIKQTGSLNISDALVKYVPGITINEVAGNPFQPDVQFRGFTASPVSGTPQGLAVYQNGVRINEAFGDTVNWDLIPTAAIKSVNLVTNNPAFGLNALGGAVDIQMKDGFNYHGAEIDTMGGSFGRVQSSLQWGKQIDNFAVYGALEGVHDDGFRNFSDIERPPLLRRRRRQERSVRIPCQHGRRRQRFRRRRDHAGRTAAAILGRDLHHAANLDQQGRLRQFDRKGRGLADLDHRRHRACADLQPEHPGRQSDRHPAMRLPMRHCFALATAARRPTA